MVKFTDPSFQDAYLTSLRNHDDLDSPPPRVATRKKYGSGNSGDSVGGDEIGGYTSRNEIGSKKKKDTSSATTNTEEYTSPIIQRSQQRTHDRLSFLKKYEEISDGVSSSTAAAASLARREGKTLEQKRQEEIDALPRKNKLGYKPRSLRMKKLWDFDGDEGGEGVEGRDEISSYDYSYNASKRNNNSEEEEDSKSGEVWSSFQIRQELRRHITKQAKSELSEMEEFTAGMRKRIQHYSPLLKKDDGTRVVLDKKINVDRSGNDEDGGNVDLGIELRLTRTHSSEEKKAIDDDGYGKRVRRGGNAPRREGNGDIDTMIHRFQTARIRHSPHTRDDELMMNQQHENKPRASTSSDANTAAYSKQDQAKRIASYRGMNQHEPEDDKSQDSEEYFSTSSDNDGARDKEMNSGNYYSPRNARLQRIRELKRNQQLDEEREAWERSCSSSRRVVGARVADNGEGEMKAKAKEQQSKDEKMDVDAWWKEHKQRQNRLGSRYNPEDDKNVGTSPNTSSEDRIDSWWKAHQSKRGGIDARSFEELAGEPTVSDSKLSSLRGRRDVDAVGKNNDARERSTAMGGASPLPILEPGQLSPMKTTPTYSRKRFEQHEKTASGTKNSVATTSTSLAGYHTRQNENDCRPDPPIPERNSSTPSQTSRSERKDILTRSSTYARKSSSNNNITPDRTRVDAVRTPPPSSVITQQQPRHTPASILTDVDNNDDNNTEMSNRSSNAECQSVAQSTLSMLLSRIEKAKVNFSQALADGDVARQAELASLLSKLGEAAVTMKKLEQT